MTAPDDVLSIDLEALVRLLPRYAIDGPRYTSYPTAPVWQETYGPQEYREDLASSPGIGGDDPVSVYVHVPFCRALCHFCACNRVVTRDRRLGSDYLEKLEVELDLVRSCMPAARAASQLHLGGGTPTWLSPDELSRLLDSVTARFPLREDAELSIEADPRVTTPEHVRRLAEHGASRLSLGVQDFDERVQRAIHRVQSAEQTAHLVDLAREAGFRSVNFDLIYGLPHQRPQTFERTLDRILAMAPDRIALYSYAHVTWVARQQRGFEREDLPDAGTKLAIFLLAIRRLLAAGYEYIGLDHFARSSEPLAVARRDHSLRRNFMGHTTQAGVELIGFGPSAISELRTGYAQSQRRLADWSSALRHGNLATLRGHRLTPRDRERRWIIDELMCHGEVRADAFARIFGRSFAASYAAELSELELARRDGLVTSSGDGDLRVSGLGRLLVRNLAMVFDAYLPEQRRSGTRIFSRTV